MKSGIRSIGITRETATAASTTLAEGGTSRTPSGDTSIRARRGRASSSSFMALLQAVGEELGDVAGLDGVADLLRLHPVLEHREAERAGGGQDVGLHLHR